MIWKGSVFFLLPFCGWQSQMWPVIQWAHPCWWHGARMGSLVMQCNPGKESLGLTQDTGSWVFRTWGRSTFTDATMFNNVVLHNQYSKMCFPVRWASLGVRRGVLLCILQVAKPHIVCWLKDLLRCEPPKELQGKSMKNSTQKQPSSCNATLVYMPGITETSLKPPRLTDSHLGDSPMENNFNWRTADMDWKSWGVFVVNRPGVKCVSLRMNWIHKK